MYSIRLILLVLILLPVGAANLTAQGALELSGRVKIGAKVEKVERKRFYLFRGGLEANKPLIDRIKAATYTSRDCFYCQAKASPQFIAWLKAEDCESPYCRAVTTEDVTKVPEFQAAYQKGLKQFRNKPDVARNWLTTNLTPALRDGFYKQQKSSITSILGTTKAVQSSMTDSVSVVAIFLDIAIQPSAGKTVETFTVSIWYRSRSAEKAMSLFARSMSVRRKRLSYRSFRSMTRARRLRKSVMSWFVT
ncbi:MAG: hypothetical protein IPO41_06485 [Acidobacteria bacterium]|nr:hypothetical protein [Acidobacteriota bacterium]